MAQGALLEHGPLFPANVFTSLPLIERAAGGSLLFGLGGDELFDRLRWAHVRDVLARRRRPEPRDAARLAAAVLPGSLRARLATDAGVVAGELGWLREPARRELRALERAEAAEPVRWPRAVRAAGEHRGVLLVADALGRLATRAHVAVGLPLLDPAFIAALARAGGAVGWSERTSAMRAVAAGALPDSVLARRGKAVFNRTLFGTRSREFAESWSGQGLDEEIVDTETLRAAWLAPMPDFRSALLLQVAWLHDRVLTESASGHAEARLQGVV